MTFLVRLELTEVETVAEAVETAATPLPLGKDLVLPRQIQLVLTFLTNLITVKPREQEATSSMTVKTTSTGPHPESTFSRATACNFTKKTETKTTAPSGIGSTFGWIMISMRNTHRFGGRIFPFSSGSPPTLLKRGICSMPILRSAKRLTLQDQRLSPSVLTTT